MRWDIAPEELLLAIIALLCAALYGNGSCAAYILAYSFAFLFLLCGEMFSAAPVREKAKRAVSYGLILAAQILFAVLVLQPAGPGMLYRLTGVLAVFFPFLVRYVWEQ